MRIKITHHLIGQIADKIEITDEAIIRNGESFKLDSIPAMIEPTEETPSPDNGPVYMLDAETISLDYGYSYAEQFDFINGNLMRYHDLNNDGVFDLSEARAFFNDFLSKDEESRREVRKGRMENYLETHSKEEWKRKGLI